MERDRKIPEHVIKRMFEIVEKPEGSSIDVDINYENIEEE